MKEPLLARRQLLSRIGKVNRLTINSLASWLSSDVYGSHIAHANPNPAEGENKCVGSDTT